MKQNAEVIACLNGLLKNELTKVGPQNCLQSQLDPGGGS